MKSITYGNMKKHQKNQILRYRKIIYVQHQQGEQMLLPVSETTSRKPPAEIIKGALQIFGSL
jgi:hypothetical protein